MLDLIVLNSHKRHLCAIKSRLNNNYYFFTFLVYLKPCRNILKPSNNLRYYSFAWHPNRFSALLYFHRFQQIKDDRAVISVV